jgi:hypothetical protein
MLLRFADATLVVGSSVSPTIFERMMKFSAIRIRIGQVASRIVYMVAGNKSTKDEVFRALAYGVSSILGPVEMDHAV